jgi:glycosyltransferase involved in cell wall biosynthesis
MNILFLTDNFPPEVNAPASRVYDHCAQWVREGHNVTVITCFPNFPLGKIFAGYKNSLFYKEDMSGIKVIRVWTFIAPNEGIFMRTFDYFSFMISSFVAGLFLRRLDVIIGTSPQFFTVISAFMLSHLKSVPWVFELRDIWPESIRAVGAIHNKTIIKTLEKLEMFLYKKADAIISVTDSFKNILKKRGINHKKIFVVKNGIDLDKFTPLKKDRKLTDLFSLENKFVVGYIGTHGLAHSLETVLFAAHQLQKQSENSYHFLLLGDGARKKYLITLSKQLNLKNVNFLNSVSKDNVPKYWSLLDASIIHLKKDKLFTSVIPSKIFESMGMGIPILLGLRGEAARIINQDKVGITFSPENYKELVIGLKKMKGNKKLRKQFIDNCITVAPNYNRKKLANDMLNVLIKIVNI